MSMSNKKKIRKIERICGYDEKELMSPKKQSSNDSWKELIKLREEAGLS